jgi:hypothetical protein
MQDIWSMQNAGSKVAGSVYHGNSTDSKGKRDCIASGERY